MLCESSISCTLTQYSWFILFILERYERDTDAMHSQVFSFVINTFSGGFNMVYIKTFFYTSDSLYRVFNLSFKYNTIFRHS